MTLGIGVASILYFTKYRLGGLMTCAIERGQLHYIDLIEKGCAGLGETSSLTSIMWVLVTISSMFYTVFLFDTLGDVVGFDGAFRCP